MNWKDVLAKYDADLEQEIIERRDAAKSGRSFCESLLRAGLVDGVDVAALQTDVDGFPDALKNLTAGEIGELENIGATTISAAQWGYLGATNQGVATTDLVTFNSVTATGSILVDTIYEASITNGVYVDGVHMKDGLVDAVDIAALKTDVDGFPDALKNLTAFEIAQLENIGATTIDATPQGLFLPEVLVFLALITFNPGGTP